MAHRKVSQKVKDFTKDFTTSIFGSPAAPTPSTPVNSASRPAPTVSDILWSTPPKISRSQHKGIGWKAFMRVVVTLVTSLLRLGARKFLVTWVAVRDDDLQAAENSKTFADTQAHLKLKRAESKGNSSGHVRAPRFRKRHATELDANGTKDCHRKSSTQAPSNVSISASASDVTVADKTIRDAPLNLGPLKGWGIKKDGISMSAVEYAQNVWKLAQEPPVATRWLIRHAQLGGSTATHLIWWLSVTHPIWWLSGGSDMQQEPYRELPVVPIA
ncbi:hypothetical protein B0H13DRAFT_1902746 [Mycena leptocephala]|nr:hypothetical protein B0H13DRAFT_1902746 [Mycena leptocephala]